MRIQNQGRLVDTMHMYIACVYRCDVDPSCLHMQSKPSLLSQKNTTAVQEDGIMTATPECAWEGG